MRKPKIENKYNLTFNKIKQLKVLNEEAIHKAPFWRNDAINAWCICGCVSPNKKDTYGTFEEEFWFGIYDTGKIDFNCSCYGGMCGYTFNKFYAEEDIDNELDLLLHEKILKIFNKLLDDKVLEI